MVRAALVGFAAALVFVPSASADILATVEVPSADGSNSDIAIVNAATGARTTLPSGVNTADNELHPSIAPDGKRLVFQRTGDGTDRIVVVDLSSGTSADLFNTFAAQQIGPTTPWISADGSSVLTGGQFTSTLSLTTTPISSFPGGPFSHTATTFPINLDTGGLLNPVQRGAITAAGLQNSNRAFASNQIFLPPASHDPAFPAGSTTALFGHPALDDTDGIVAYERATDGLSPYTLRYRSSDPGVTTTSDTAFPSLVNASGANTYEFH